MDLTYTYYALFSPDTGDPTATNVAFPDIFGGTTFGYGEEEALYMAKDFLRSMLQIAPEQCMPPSSEEKLRALFPDKRIVPITVDV